MTVDLQLPARRFRPAARGARARAGRAAAARPPRALVPPAPVVPPPPAVAACATEPDPPRRAPGAAASAARARAAGDRLVGLLRREGARLGRRRSHAARDRLLLRPGREPGLDRARRACLARRDRLRARLRRRPLREAALRGACTTRRSPPSGAGIAGGYMTLLAAKVLYDLVPDWAAMLIAAGIAAVGVATALAWSSELIAGLGLVGATLAPAALGLESGELTAAGTGFAALVFAGTAIVAIRQRWSTLLGVGVAATLPQVAVLLAQAEPDRMGRRRCRRVLLAPLPRRGDRLAGPAGLACARLAARVPARAQRRPRRRRVGGPVRRPRAGLGDARRGGVYGLVAAFLFPTRRHRDLSALNAAVALALIAVALADLLSGPSLAVAWAAEAAVLAWLARAVGDVRYQLASLAYLVAALVSRVFVDAPADAALRSRAEPSRRRRRDRRVAFSAAIAAWYCRAWGEAEPARGVFAPLEPSSPPSEEPARLAAGARGASGSRRLRRVARACSGWPSGSPQAPSSPPSSGVTSPSPGSGASPRSPCSPPGTGFGRPIFVPPVSSGWAPCCSQTFIFVGVGARRQPARLRVPRRRGRAARRSARRPAQHSRRRRPLVCGRGGTGQHRPRRRRTVRARRRRAPRASRSSVWRRSTARSPPSSSSRDRDLSLFLWAPALGRPGTPRGSSSTAPGSSSRGRRYRWRSSRSPTTPARSA